MSLKQKVNKIRLCVISFVKRLISNDDVDDENGFIRILSPEVTNTDFFNESDYLHWKYIRRDE